MTLNVLHQYALRVLFVSPAPSLDVTLDNTAAPVRNPFPFVHKPNTIDGDRIIVPAGHGLGRLGLDRGVARRLRRESVGRMKHDGIDSDSDSSA